MKTALMFAIILTCITGVARADENEWIEIIRTEVLRLSVSSPSTAPPAPGSSSALSTARALEVKALPAAKALYAEYAKSELNRDRALIALKLAADLTSLDSGEYEAELILPLRRKSEFAGLLRRCPRDGEGSDQAILPKQERLIRAHLKPLTTADICLIHHLLEDATAIGGNG